MVRWHEAEHLDPARVGVAVALEDLDGGGLAGTVRPEQGQDLTPIDREVDALQDLAGAVGLAEPTDHDG